MVILFLIIALIVDFFLAGQFAEAAAAKGYQDRKYYWICFWLVIALPNRENNVPVISDELPDL